MKYIFNYLILPILKLSYAIFISSLFFVVAVCHQIIYSVWTLKLKSSFKDSYDYHDNIFEYISTKDEFYSKTSTHFKTAFHWALNIGGKEIPNTSYYAIRNQELPNSKETFKEFINSETKC